MQRLDKLLIEQKVLYTRWTVATDPQEKQILLEKFLLSNIEFSIELMKQEKGGETTK